MWFFAAWCYFWGGVFTFGYLGQKEPKTPLVDAFCAILWPAFIPLGMLYRTVQL
jgi:hypothetical protein